MNEAVPVVHQWLMWREGKNFLSSHSVRCVRKKLKPLKAIWKMSAWTLCNLFNLYGTELHCFLDCCIYQIIQTNFWYSASTSFSSVHSRWYPATISHLSITLSLCVHSISYSPFQFWWKNSFQCKMETQGLWSPVVLCSGAPCLEQSSSPHPTQLLPLTVQNFP